MAAGFFFTATALAQTPPASPPARAVETPVRPAASQPAIPTSQPAEFLNFATTTLDGSMVTLPGNYAGKLVLVHFWATWCPICARELPYWKEAYVNYHGRGVEFIGVPTDKNRGTNEKKVKQFVESHGLAWPQVFEDAPALSTDYQVDTIPMSFLVDGDTGQVLAKGNGTRLKNLAKQIEACLKRKEEKASAAKTGSPAAASQPAAKP